MPGAVLPAYSALFMESMATFIRNYFPVFMLGALFGKVIELSGFARALAAAVSRAAGRTRAMLGIVMICALMVYGGVSVFVVAFAVYPFAAELFRAADIPKRLIPATMALGSFTFAMDALPGSPQIQNIIPTTFFGTTTMAAPLLGPIGGVAHPRRRDVVSQLAPPRGRGGGRRIRHATISTSRSRPTRDRLRVTGARVSAAGDRRRRRTSCSRCCMPRWYGATTTLALTPAAAPITVEVSRLVAIWAVEGGARARHRTVVIFAWQRGRGLVRQGQPGGDQRVPAGVGEHGVGIRIRRGDCGAAGIRGDSEGLQAISNPLVNEAVTVTTLAGITGSASGGLSLALAAMAEQFKAAALAADIPIEVLHRVAAMAAGGMDTLPHNGAIITLLAITGLTHRQAYGDIFAITCIKTVAVFAVIGFYYLTGIV